MWTIHTMSLLNIISNEIRQHFWPRKYLPLNRPASRAMRQRFRTINPRQVRKPNNLSAILRECRSVWNERARTIRRGKRWRRWRLWNVTWEIRRERRCGSRGVKTGRNAGEGGEDRENIWNAQFEVQEARYRRSAK